MVVGVPGRIISRKGEKIEKIDLRHGNLPDPLAITLSTLNARIEFLENKLLDEKNPKELDIEIFFGEHGSGI